MSAPSVLALVPEWNACTAWRVAWPFNELRRQGYHVAYTTQDDPNAWRVAEGFDSVLIQRMAWTDIRVGRQYINGLHRAGKRVFLECDDDMWMAREDQKSHEEMGIDKPEATIDQNRESTKLYDGVIVSTERLRTVVQSFAPTLPIEVVPNLIDLQYWAQCLKQGWRRKFDDRVTIGWAGGDRYDRDFGILAEAWRQTAAMHPAVHFIVMGHQPEPLLQAVPESRRHALPWMPLQSDGSVPTYAFGLSEMDVGCCSVAPTMFNACKTPIKVWEMTASGVAVVGSSWLYGPEIEHGRDGFIADTVDEWVYALDRLVRSRARRRKLRTRMLRKVEERSSLDAGWWRHPDAWARLMERSEARASILVPAGVSV